MTVTIYHNPRCSKSRQTLAVLQERGIEPDVIAYLDNPPDGQALAAILDLLVLEPRELMRRKEAAYTDAGLDDPEITREALISAMEANPVIIERPIVLANGKAALGRPPEAVLDIL